MLKHKLPILINNAKLHCQCPAPRLGINVSKVKGQNQMREGELNKLHTALTRQDLQHGVVQTVHQPSCHHASSDPMAPGSEKSEGTNFNSAHLTPHLSYQVKSESEK